MTGQEERRRQVLKRLTKTAHGETVCLMYWEVAVLLDYIDDLKRGYMYEKTTETAGSKGPVAGNGR